MDRYIKTVKLKGSPAQVAWATDIRTRLVAEAEQACRSFLASLSGDPALCQTQQQEISAAMTAFAGRTDARWWITHRDEDGADLFWRTLPTETRARGRSVRPSMSVALRSRLDGSRRLQPHPVR